MSTSVQHVGELLKNAVLINAAESKRADTEDSYIILSAGKEADGTVIMSAFVVNSFTNEVESFDVLYSMKTKWNQPRQNAEFGGNPLHSPDSTISIADLLNYGKEYFSDMLSDDVIAHFGIDRSPTEITQRIRYSRRSYGVSNQEFNSDAMNVAYGMQDTEGKRMFSLRSFNEDYDSYRTMLLNHNVSVCDVNDLFDTIDEITRGISPAPARV